MACIATALGSKGAADVGYGYGERCVLYNVMDYDKKSLGGIDGVLEDERSLFGRRGAGLFVYPSLFKGSFCLGIVQLSTKIGDAVSLQN